MVGAGCMTVRSREQVGREDLALLRRTGTLCEGELQRAKQAYPAATEQARASMEARLEEEACSSPPMPPSRGAPSA